MIDVDLLLELSIAAVSNSSFPLIAITLMPQTSSSQTSSASGRSAGLTGDESCAGQRTQLLSTAGVCYGK
jgi:hypothetical protein